MRNAIIVRAGASGRTRYNYVGAAAAPAAQPQLSAAQRAAASAAEAEAAAAERMRKIAEYNDLRDAYFARNCVE